MNETQEHIEKLTALKMKVERHGGQDGLKFDRDEQALIWGVLLREVTLAGVLEAAAHALRSGRGLIGDGAGDVVREIWHNYPVPE